LTIEYAQTGPRVIVALDFPTANEALAFTARITPQQCRLKVGFELFTSAGPTVVETLVEKGFDVFLDLKYHDIPNTVARSCAAAARLGVWMLNVHTLGGRNMMQAAREAVDQATQRPLLIGVTVLTSHSADDLHEIGLGGDTTSQVLRLAHLAKQSGLDGVVCSAQEAPQLCRENGNDFCLVTPGIRPSSAAVGDQQRIMTPSQAIHAGAHYLVIGRPITAASDPLMVLAAIDRELRNPV